MLSDEVVMLLEGVEGHQFLILLSRRGKLKCLWDGSRSHCIVTHLDGLYFLDQIIRETSHEEKEGGQIQYLIDFSGY